MKLNRLAGLAALGACVCLAQEPKKETKPVKPATKQKAASGVGQSGMVIVRTPDGGMRAPTAEEHQALTGQGLSSVQVTTGAPSQPEALGGGRGVKLVLDPATTRVFSVARKGPDGKLILQEAVGDEAAEGLMKDAAPVVKTEKKEAEQ